MKRLLSTSTALSLAFAPVQPWPLFAQTLLDDGSIVAADGTVLCQPTAEQPCDLEAILKELAEGGQVPPVTDDAAAAAAAAEAQRQADEAAAAAAAEAQRQADEAAAAAAAEAQRQADEAAAAAAAEAQRQADEAAAATAAEAQRQADEAAAAAAAEAQRQADEAAATAAAEAQRQADEAAAAAAEPAQTEPPTETPLTPEAEAALAAAAEAEAAAQVAATEAPEEQVQPVDVPVVSEEVVQSVTDLLTEAPAASGAEAAAPVAAAATDPGTATPAPEDVTVTTVTEADTRSSFEEFAAAPQLVDGGKKKSGLSDLEKVGLFALGALVVGSVLNDGREVVSNTGDRVIVRDPQGGFSVYKDDDTLLRRPGSTVRTESFRDGSTRTIVDRDDGTQVVTIRDAAGRVLRRASYDARGNETVLIDDLVPEEAIDISTLPPPRQAPIQITTSTRSEDASLRAELARIEAQRIGRSFSLRQIRSVKEVRHLAASIDVNNVTFDTGSAVIRTEQARNLADLGLIMQDMLDRNPGELFLIEGHTDAVGSASSNLILSDRRAESVALALTEFFGVPPENMVVQGYGESDLRIATQADERANRRVSVRVIGPLMRTAALQ